MSNKKTFHKKNRVSNSWKSFSGDWRKLTGLLVGSLALLLIVVAGFLSTYYKDRIMPSVSVAGKSYGSVKVGSLEEDIKQRSDQVKVKLVVNKKTLSPTNKELGLDIDVNKTVEEAKLAKRQDGLFNRLAFWRKTDVPANITVNRNLLSQYVSAKLPELTKAPKDSQLVFDSDTQQFTVTPQADGEQPNIDSINSDLLSLSSNLDSKDVKVSIDKRGPVITEDKVSELVDPANKMVSRNISFVGAGQSFRASASDIASWLVPKPQKDNSLKLVIDKGKIQSYVDQLAKQISKSPVDKKVISDKNTGKEVVLQQGQDGTKLSGKETLADLIATNLQDGQDVISHQLNIVTAKHKTISMSSYSKWIEVDLGEQRTTAYEGANPVKSFIVATGLPGHDTVQGEFEIWHKTRSQTMSGGSKADGSYYSIPNVEWVSYFFEDYALHGAWWREKFGAPASHGCVNMTNQDAKWIYDWAPMKTKVIVHA